jgi:hypothetical protein
MPQPRSPVAAVSLLASASSDQVLELDAGIFGGDRAGLLDRLSFRSLSICPHGFVS